MSVNLVALQVSMVFSNCLLVCVWREIQFNLIFGSNHSFYYYSSFFTSQSIPQCWYISCIPLHLFFPLQDGQDLPPPIGFDVETPTTIPPCKVIYFNMSFISIFDLQLTCIWWDIYGQVFPCTWQLFLPVDNPGQLFWLRWNQSSHPSLSATVSVFSHKGFLQNGLHGLERTSWSQENEPVFHVTVHCRYYSIYDSADRQPLLDAYHDGASLSLTTPYSTQNPSR